MTVNKSAGSWLAQRPYVLAIAISITLVLWMLSGVMQAQEKEVANAKNQAPIPKVKVETMVASPVHNTIALYGRTEPDRIARLKAQTNGRVVEILAERGSFVQKGQPLVKIELNDLNIQLGRAEAEKKQREIEYEGAKSLNAQGYQGQAQLAASYTNLMTTKADIARLQLAIEHATIKAPFDGVMDIRNVELGDYVAVGDDVAQITDLDPLIVRAYVTENQVNNVSLNQVANIKLVNASDISGQVRYIASVADEKTNTFKIEVAIDNSQHKLFSGISAEVDIPLQEVMAIRLSPALLALDESGNIGVKSVVDKTVVFTPINMVKSEKDGVWLSGLGDVADVIVLGQGFVRTGDAVEPVFDTK